MAAEEEEEEEENNMVLATHPPTCISPLVGDSNRNTTGQDLVRQQQKQRSVDCGPQGPALLCSTLLCFWGS